MKVIPTDIPEVLLLEPRVFEDARGFTLEAYNRRTFEELTGMAVEFVQDNRSRSARNVIRGLHYEAVRPQGKLISAVRGEIFDVAVDLRRSSRSFGKWVGFTLSDTNFRLLWIPPGFAHGFLVLSETADVMYKLSDFWSPEHERTISWNDTELGIPWPLSGDPALSARDASGVPFSRAELFP
jgi:dTDP-4-dehydrorhamnose 3,5-epimerase